MAPAMNKILITFFPRIALMSGAYQTKSSLLRHSFPEDYARSLYPAQKAIFPHSLWSAGKWPSCMLQWFL